MSELRAPALAGIRFRPALLALAVALLGSALTLARPALATPVSVTPTTVVLGPGHATALITLTNEGDEAARFQADVNAWSETREGQTTLVASGDVVVFPQLVTLAPHESKKVRIGTELAPGAAERSYRLILQELPAFNRDTGEVKIQVLSKISLPIFYVPRNAQAKPAIDAATLAHGTLNFDVVNGGEAHVMVRRIDVTGRSASGESFSLNSNGWYVLAGGRRAYRLDLSDADCRRSAEIVIRATADSAPVEMRLPVRSTDCGNARETRFVKIDSGTAPPF